MEVFTKIVFRLVLVFVAQVKGIESYTFLVHIWDFGFHLWCVILSRKKYFVFWYSLQHAANSPKNDSGRDICDFCNLSRHNRKLNGRLPCLICFRAFLSGIDIIKHRTKKSRHL